jgi:hypothetical protein
MPDTPGIGCWEIPKFVAVNCPIVAVVWLDAITGTESKFSLSSTCA